MDYGYAILIGYCLGCVNPAYFFAKAKGFDIRTRGTGNCGASNAKVTMGWKYGLFCAIYDALKAGASMLIIHYIFQGNEASQVLAGVFAVIGHCFPFYLRFKGGKGFASFMGMACILNWKYFLCMLIIGILLTILTNWIVSATFSAIITFPVFVYYQHNPKILSLIICIASIVILYKHRVNIYKFIRKREIGLNGKYVGIPFIKDNKYILEK